MSCNNGLLYLVNNSVAAVVESVVYSSLQPGDPGLHPGAVGIFSALYCGSVVLSYLVRQTWMGSDRWRLRVDMEKHYVRGNLGMTKERRGLLMLCYPKNLCHHNYKQKLIHYYSIDQRRASGKLWTQEKLEKSNRFEVIDFWKKKHQTFCISAQWWRLRIDAKWFNMIIVIGILLNLFSDHLIKNANSSLMFKQLHSSVGRLNKVTLLTSTGGTLYQTRSFPY